MKITNKTSQLEEPLVLVRIEEKKGCLGHCEKQHEYRHREDARKSAQHWLEQNQSNTIYKKIDYDLVKKKSHKYWVYHRFIHIDDAKVCDHYQFIAHRELFLIESKHFIEFNIIKVS